MRFGTLGPLMVRTAQGHPLPMRGGKRAVLAAILMLRTNRDVSVTALVDQVWPAGPPASAVANLQTYIADLRRLLGGEAARLRTSRHAYRLAAGDDEVDHLLFRRLIGDAGRYREAGRPAGAIDRLARALALWRADAVAEGVPLPDALAAEVTQLTELRWTAIQDHVDLRLALGLRHGLEAELATLTAAQPLRERLWAQLMLIRHLAGRRDSALAAYAQAHDTLDRELGMPPGSDLRELRRRILADDPALVPDPAARPAVRPAVPALPRDAGTAREGAVPPATTARPDCLDATMDGGGCCPCGAAATAHTSEAGYRQISTTTGSRGAADTLAATAVAAHLAVRAQVVGPVTSTYWTEDDIDRAEEYLVLFTTSGGDVPALRRYLRDRRQGRAPVGARP